MNIFLDMDGVLVNFTRAACKLLKQDEKEVLGRWTPGEWETHHAVGMTKEEFDKRVDEAGEEFWYGMEPYPWADELFDFCTSLAPTFILSASTLDGSSLSGKLKWLHKWKGSSFRDFVFTYHKERCAKHDRVLIDDRTSNIDKFIAHGGSGIIFPGINNSRHHIKTDIVQVVKNEIVQWYQATKET